MTSQTVSPPATSSQAIDWIHERVQQNGEIAFSLNVGYEVVFNAASGNIPVTKRAEGTLLDLPVRLEFDHALHRSTKGSFPVNTRFRGSIGDFSFSAAMPYEVVFSTLAGNIPVNTGVSVDVNGKAHFMRFDRTIMNASSPGGGGPASKKPGVHIAKAAKYIAGQAVEVASGGDGSGPGQIAGRQVISGLKGAIDDFEIELTFRYSYYYSASSGQNPVISKIKGVIRSLK